MAQRLILNHPCYWPFWFAIDWPVGRTLSYGRDRSGAWSVADGNSYMAEGYCVKCKAKKEIVDGVEEVMKNGRKAIKGKCPTCGTVMFKILGGKATASDATPTPTNPPASN